MKTEFFSTTASKRPDFVANCRIGEGDVLVDNGQYGKILHAIVLGDDGKPLYDLPIHWSRGGGGVAVPVTDTGRICFVENFRPVAGKPTERGSDEPPTDLSRLGIASLELPRGFADDAESWETTALREAAEEVALTMSSPARIGSVNPNTSTTVHSAGAFAARAGAPVPGSSPKANPSERILSVQTLSEQEVWEAIGAKKIFCGFTLAALMLFFAWPGREDFIGRA